MPKRPRMKVSEPPPQRVSPYDWDYIASKLMRSPGEWHEIWRQDKTSYVSTLRQGRIAALKPEYGFELRTTNNKREDGDMPRVCDLFMRYSPEQDERED